MDSKTYDLIGVNMAEPNFGIQVGPVVLKTHGEAQCQGPLHENGRPRCCIHNQSSHHMVTWDQNWRADRRIMERICSHGVGHPDPDDLRVLTESDNVHTCDGCCSAPTN